MNIKNVTIIEYVFIIAVFLFGMAAGRSLCRSHLSAPLVDHSTLIRDFSDSCEGLMSAQLLIDADGPFTSYNCDNWEVPIDGRQ